jgi:hypothetical protein
MCAQCMYPEHSVSCVWFHCCAAAQGQVPQLQDVLTAQAAAPCKAVCMGRFPSTAKVLHAAQTCAPARGHLLLTRTAGGHRGVRHVGLALTAASAVGTRLCVGTSPDS